MPEFRIESTPRVGDPACELHRVKISAGENVLTRLTRIGDPGEDDCLEVPAEALAFWFMDNWWRIRWEPDPPSGFTSEWRLAHDVSSVGGGYFWPRIALWGEGDQLGVAARADGRGSSLRYLSHGDYFVKAATFEASVDAFIQSLLQSRTPDRTALEACHERLLAERNDPDLAAWRRLEAQLGFDQDEAPEDLMTELSALADEYGFEGIQEAALARQGREAAAALQQAIQVAQDSAIQLTSAIPTDSVEVDVVSERPPWQVAEDAARQVRANIGLPNQPLRNRALSELVGFNVAAKVRGAPKDVGYGLRLCDRGNDVHNVSLHTKRRPSRRFEICRALGDIFWSGGDRLGPLSPANSARQKFQRAFAQSLLCPFESLRAYLRANRPDIDDMQAAAEYFHVPIRVVPTVLVNKGVISRRQFETMIAVT